MSRAISILIVLIMAFVLVPIGLNSNTAYAQGEIVNCQVATGPQVRVVCRASGVVVLNQTVPVPTVTVPPIPSVTITAPGATVTVPGPPITVPGPPGVNVTETVTVRPPTETRTVTAPGPTNTVVRTETQTITVGPTALPTQTVTETEAGQTITERVTISSSPTQGPDRDLIPDSPSGVAVVAGIGLFLLLGLLLLGLWLGYIVGYKDSDRKNSNFLRALSDKLLLSRRH